jgi:hypothetical protein
VLYSKLHFHCHVDYAYSQELRTLVLIRLLHYNFSSIVSCIILYNALIRPKLEYASEAILEWLRLRN